MHVRILFANPSHNANSVTEFDFLWRANANANFVLLILRNEECCESCDFFLNNEKLRKKAASIFGKGLVEGGSGFRLSDEIPGAGYVGWENW